jgi:RHS repeat-associated protein
MQMALFIGRALAIYGFLTLCLNPAHTDAQEASFGDGVKGWCTIQFNAPEVCLATADQACHKQWESYGPPFSSLSRYVGAYATRNPRQFDCDWTGNDDGRCDGGNIGCLVPAPGFVRFFCNDGYHPNGFAQCVKDAEDAPARDDNCKSNFGGVPNPKAGNPVALFDGAKIEYTRDFTTADNRFSIERYYRSIPQIYGVQATNGIIAGAIGGWRFGFEIELHLQERGGDRITLHQPNGVAYDFYRSGTQFLPTPGANPQGDFEISFAGSAPTNWSDIAGRSTLWKVKDAVDRVWTLQTFRVLNIENWSSGDSPLFNIARPIKMTAPGGYTWNFSYNSNGALTSIVDTFNRTFNFSWNYLIYPRKPILDEDDKKWIDLPVSIAGISLPGGQSLKYTYDPDVLEPGSSVLAVRRLTKVELLDANGARVDATSYHYENATYPDFLTGITDARNARYATFAYDERGRVRWTTHAGQQDTYSVSYNTPAPGLPNELIRTVTNPLGKKAEYHWLHEANGNLSKLTSVVGQASTNCPSSASAYTYDANSFVRSQTDEEGRITSFLRDARARPTSITRGTGSQASTTTVQWSAVFNLPIKIEEPGLTTTIEKDTTGLVTEIKKTDTTTQTVPYSTNGQSRIWSFGYNSTGQLTSVDGPLAGTGDTIRYAYNTAGAIQRFTDEVGNVTIATAWNALGQPTSLTDPNGVVTALTYDGRGRVKTISVDTANDPAVTTIDYSAVGDVTKITQPNGVYEIYAYDGARRLTSVTNSAGEKTTYTRDAMGNAKEIVVTRANATVAYRRTQVFDELGRLIRSIGAGSQTHSFGYDKTGNLKSVRDPRSNVFSYGFDALDRLISEIDEEGATVSLTRDKQDEITAYKDARDLTTSYVRNGFGEVIQESSPDKGITVYVRDARGLVTKRTDPRGIVTNYAYDNAGRLTGKSYPSNAAYWQSFTWDNFSSSNFGKGRLGVISDDSGSNTRAFDGKGRIAIDYRKNYPAPTVTVKYNYDDAGNVVGMLYPSGRRLSIGRDAAGRINAVVTYKNSGSAGQTIASSVTWHPFGPVSGIAFGNGLNASYKLDTDYRITRVRVGPSSDPGATLDRTLSWTGETINSITDNLFPGTTPPGDYTAQTQSFTYTPTRRLKTASGYYGALSWTYDGNGNRTAQTLDGVTSPYAYPPTSNRLASVTPPGGTVRNFTYDAAGNVKTDTRAGALGMSFQYDVEGRLSKAWRTSSATIGGTYRYDAQNRLVSRTVTQTGVTTLYVHDLDDHIIAETDTSGQTLREYIWLGDIPLAVVDKVATGSPVIYYVHADHIGRPARMTAQNQAWVWDVIYSPFGETSYIWTNPGTLDIRFPGQWFQLESGLHYNWHRHYDASIGRYVQADPLREEEKEGATIGGQSSLVEQIYLWPDASRFSRPEGGLGVLSLKRANYPNGPSIYGYSTQNPLAKFDADGLIAGGGYTLRLAPNPSIELCEKKKKSHRFRCTECGTPHGGVYGDLCPECTIKALPPGTPPTPYEGDEQK